MIKRLRLKFIITIMLIVSIMMSVICITIYSFTRFNYEQECMNTMREIASNPFRMEKPGFSRDIVAMPYFVLWGSFNTELVTFGGYFDLSDEYLLQAILDTLDSSEESIGFISAYNLRYMRMESPVGSFIIFVDISNEITALRSLTKTLIIISILSISVFHFISIFLSRWFVKPVENAINDQKQFISDASHELKTPLTVILTNTDLLQQDYYPAETKMILLRSIQSMSLQMRDLVNELLQLARIDNGIIKKELSKTDLSEIVNDEVMSYEPLCFENSKTLNSDIAPAIQINGSYQHLHQLIRIFLDNAMKYSDTDTVINVTLSVLKRGWCRLTVVNSGAEIPKEHLQDIFKRFYRCDVARENTHSYGLGLSIAENIVLNHHGKIWAESCDHKNYFYVELPTV